MNQQTTSTKIIKDLKMVDVFSTNQLEAIRVYLNMAYSIGFNEGNSLRGSPRPIVQLTRSGIKIKDFGSIAEASRVLGIKQPNVVDVLKDRKPTAGGFRFAYKT